MPATSKTDQVNHLIDGADEVIKGHDKKHPKRKQVPRPWVVEERLRDDASDFWKHLFRHRGTNWKIRDRYKNEREATDNCTKLTTTMGNSLEYRVRNTEAT